MFYSAALCFILRRVQTAVGSSGVVGDVGWTAVFVGGEECYGQNFTFFLHKTAHFAPSMWIDRIFNRVRICGNINIVLTLLLLTVYYIL